MTRFEETVAKIAASPVKRALVRHAPTHLFKQAAFKDVLRDAGTNALGALLSGGAVGAGAWGAGKLLDHFDQSSDRLEAERKQIGQLAGEQKFRSQALHGLAPLHNRVFTSMGEDATLAKADPELINSSYQTMKRFAPHLAADPNAARSFLREAVLYGTGPSYATLKTLADAEQSVSRAGAMGA